MFKNKNKKWRLLMFIASIIISFFVQAQAQTVKITGTVSDEKEVIIGATVRVKGYSNLGTATNVNGAFTLQVPVAAKTLEVSFIGYDKQTIDIDKQTSFKIVLVSNQQSLNEVVVVGYGTMKKRDVTGAITSISADEINGSKTSTVLEAMQGKVAGMVIQGSSEPGAGSSVMIRGASSLSTEAGANSPLYIVDGMEVSSISNLNPNDIASIEVLKDAASASIYGSKSANGVLLITTVQGKEGAPKISLNYSYRNSNIGHKIPAMNRQQGIDYVNMRNYATGLLLSTNIENVDTYNPVFIQDNYIQDLLFRNAPTQKIDFSIAGANKSLKYYMGAGYMDDQGIQINTYNKQLSVRSNVDYAVSKNFLLGSRLSLTKTNRRTGSPRSRGEMLTRPANYPIYELDGSFSPVIWGRANPMAEAILGGADTDLYDVNMNQFLEFTFLKDFKFRPSISTILSNSLYNDFNPAILDLSWLRNSVNQTTSIFSWTNDNVLTYAKTIGKHSFSAMAGLSYQKSLVKTTTLDVTGNVSDNLPISYSYMKAKSTTNSIETGNALASMFGRVSYSYLGRYLFNANVRRDGSSRFGLNKRYGTFPSASVGWRFSDEKFMKFAKTVMDDAKIRVSYGKTGSQGASNFPWQGLYGLNVYAGEPGFYPSQLENKDLSWETTQQLNFGLDLNMFNSRLNIVVDYYKKQTSDVLFRINIPETTGFSSVFRNIGNVDNEGYELAINTVNIKTKNLQWKTGLTLAFNNNMISSVPPGGRLYSNDMYVIDKGFALGTMFGYKALNIFSYNESNNFDMNWNQLTPIYDERGVFQEFQLNGQTYTGQRQQKLYGAANGKAFAGGDVNWEDINHDGVIDENDRQVIGNGAPKVTGGFNNSIIYKGFSLSAFFSFSFGGDIYKRSVASNNSWILTSITRGDPRIVAQSWVAPGDDAKYPILNDTKVENTRQTSSLWIEDGSFIRLKNLKIGYDLPQAWLKPLHVKSLNVYCMLQDYFTWTKYSMFDPEMAATGYNYGMDVNMYPRSKSMLFGINLNF
jgi:TonB-linked SusC/RagA family outer membrane protein